MKKRWEAVLVAMGLRDLPLRDDDTEYPPFRLNGACPKCGFDGVETGRQGHSVTFTPACTEVRGAFRVSFRARMRRYCRRCGASWFELPQDETKATG